MRHSLLEKSLNFFLAIVAVKFLVLLFSVSSMEKSEAGVSFLWLFLFFVVAGILLAVIKQAGTGHGYSGRGSSVLLEESLFDKLRRRYEAIAEQYREQGQYLKASNIHMRLLQNPYRAAAVLEEGGLYNEAAVLYLKKMENKQSAAQCYEKGKNYKKAIELYKELGNKEKTGDLYILLNDRTAAHNCYESLITDYTSAFQYVKASLVARHKMQDNEKARELLLKGWNNNADAFNCINNYFASFCEHDDLIKAIGDIYAAAPELQKETLLTALKYEFNKAKEMEETTRDIAYEIIADFIQRKPSIASEMKHFNPSDKIILKDIIRYKAAANKITANHVPFNIENK